MNDLFELNKRLTEHEIFESIERSFLLRSIKCAEFSLALSGLLGFCKSSLRKLREATPTFYLFTVSEHKVFNHLPKSLKSAIVSIKHGKGIFRERELPLWEAILTLAIRIYLHKHPTLLPYPLIQLGYDRKGKVSIRTLDRKMNLHTLIPSSLNSLLEVEDGLQDVSGRSLILAHYDAHGLSMMIATYLFLISQGIDDIHCVSDYNATGDYGRFWKRTLPKLGESGEYENIFLVDLTAYTRNPLRTIKGIRTAVSTSVKLFLVDHHFDTIAMSKQISEAGCELLVTDIPGCFFASRLKREFIPYILLGALGDRDITYRHPAIWQEGTFKGKRPSRTILKALNLANEIMLALSPPPREFRKHYLFPAKAIASSSTSGFNSFLNKLKQIHEKGIWVKTDSAGVRIEVKRRTEMHLVREMHWDRLGKVALVTSQPKLTGRMWYDALEKILEVEDEALYAVCGRYLPGSGFNFLITKRWDNLTSPSPMIFLPARLARRAIGHSSAFWINLKEENAIRDITTFIRKANKYFGVRSGKITQKIETLIAKLFRDRTEKSG